MKVFSGLCITICCVCAAVSCLSILIPQKRTAKVMSFVIGLFLISTVLGTVTDADIGAEMYSLDLDDYAVPDISEDEYTTEAVHLTADNLISALNDLLIDEGIRCDDIVLDLKITDEGRIYASRVVIYINEAYTARMEDIKSITYRNLSKEPEIYVT